MTEQVEKSAQEASGKSTVSRRIFLGSIGLLGGAVVAYGVSRAGFRLWMRNAVPDDAPRIGFSLDDTWLNQLGITDTTYQHAMTRAGGRLVRMTPESLAESNDLEKSVDKLIDSLELDGILLTGGGDVDPELYGGEPDSGFLVNRVRDDFEIALIHAAQRRGLPILGICRGAQILNVAYGGTLRNLRTDDELEDTHFTFEGHNVTLVPDSLLHKILETDTLNEVLTFHGQAADQPGDTVHITATGPGEIVEAIEVGDPARDWIVAVQWHPEMEPGDSFAQKLFEAFVTETAARREKIHDE